MNNITIQFWLKYLVWLPCLLLGVSGALECSDTSSQKNIPGILRVHSMLKGLSADCIGQLVKRHNLLGAGDACDVLHTIEALADCSKLDTEQSNRVRDLLMTFYGSKYYPLALQERYRLYTGQQPPARLDDVCNTLQKFFDSCAMVQEVPLPDGTMHLIKPEYQVVPLREYRQFPLTYLAQLIPKLPTLYEGSDLARENLLYTYLSYVQNQPENRAVIEELKQMVLSYHHASIEAEDDFDSEGDFLCSLNGQLITQENDGQWHGDYLPVICSPLLHALSGQRRIGFQYCQYMPQDMEQLASTIKSLELSGCSAPVVDTVLRACADQAGGRLKKLYVHDPRKRAQRVPLMQTPPTALYRIITLRSLQLPALGLTALDERIANLQNLTLLNVANNELEELPDSIGTLKHLKSLYVGGNQLKALPETIGDLKELRVLNAVHNPLFQLPESLARCKKIQQLELLNSDGNLTIDCWTDAFNEQPHMLMALWQGSLKSAAKHPKQRSWASMTSDWI